MNYYQVRSTKYQPGVCVLSATDGQMQVEDELEHSLLNHHLDSAVYFYFTLVQTKGVKEGMILAVK